MRRLLRDMPSRLPTDCLVARIHARRSFLVHDWERLLLARQPLAALSAAPWRSGEAGGQGWAYRALQQEYYWAFSRMDEQLRRATSPFFWLAEVRTLSVCLRLMSGTTVDQTRLLQYSLLSDSIKKTLSRAVSPAAAAAGLTAALAVYDSRFAGAGEAWSSGGAGAFESALNEITLTSSTAAVLDPAMQRYIVLMIDSRNLTTIAKRLRWRLNSLPPLLAGGTISLSRLEELFTRKDSAGLLHQAMRLGGEAEYGQETELERVLFEARKRVMRRLAREADGTGVILDYLWQCGNEAANIGLLEHLETAGFERIAEDMRR